MCSSSHIPNVNLIQNGHVKNKISHYHAPNIPTGQLVCVFILQSPKAKAMQIQRTNVIKHILTIIVGLLVLLPETEIRISPRYESNIQTIQCNKRITKAKWIDALDSKSTGTRSKSIL